MKLIGTILGIFILLFFSLKFEILSDRNLNKDGKIDYSEKIEDLFNKGIINNNQKTNTQEIIKQLNQNPKEIYEKMGHRLGIGSSAYFLIEDETTVKNFENGIIELENKVIIDTKYIFGNEIRDASNFISLTEFDSQLKLNDFTGQLNAKIRKNFENLSIKKGDKLKYIGACQIYIDRLPMDELTVIPVLIEKI